ncbi:hypothetical protein DWUX_777 [Desulfovibrio diazotrophicus]|nr:hypothetical protein DWUX_777 [Desulfovibrio diazotrophicus]
MFSLLYPVGKKERNSAQKLSRFSVADGKGLEKRGLFCKNLFYSRWVG